MTFAAELALLASDCSAILESASVTYRQRTAGTFVPATGAFSGATITDLVITAIRGASTITFVGGASAKVEQVVYSALASQFSARPDADDEILDSSVGGTFRIIENGTEVDGLFYKMTTQRTM